MIQESHETLDPLSATFWRLRVPRWSFRQVCVSAPWGVEVSAGRVCFYIVRSGFCRLVLHESGEVVELRPSDFVILPHGTPHRLCDRDDSPVVSLHDLGERTRFDSNDSTTSLLVSHFALESIPGNGLLENLPSVIKLNQNSNTNLQEISQLIEAVTDEHALNHSGSPVIVGHLLHVVFLATLRAFIVNSEHAGFNDDRWLRATTDTAIGPVVKLMQSEPEKEWTVESLARRARMSRTQFSERFRDVVGQPPLQYLTEFRMQRAGELLQGTEYAIKRIAALVGYKSPTSFSIAFKRYMQQTPVSFRRACQT